MIPSRQDRKGFCFHVGAGALTTALLLFPIVRAFFSPVDIFARPESFLVGHLQFLLAAVVFYGFSSVALHLVPLPTGRSVSYTVTSWVFFLWAFYPAFSSSGMMRRIAGSYGDYQAAERLRENLHMGAMFMFAGVQIAYLVFVARTVTRQGPNNESPIR